MGDTNPMEVLLWRSYWGWKGLDPWIPVPVSLQILVDFVPCQANHLGVFRAAGQKLRVGQQHVPTSLALSSSRSQSVVLFFQDGGIADGPHLQNPVSILPAGYIGQWLLQHLPDSWLWFAPAVCPVHLRLQLQLTLCTSHPVQCRWLCIVTLMICGMK
jgi:hypothetical protein